MIETKVVCDGCGAEGNESERMDSGGIAGDRGWLTLKATCEIELPERSTTVACSDGLYHFCPECAGPIVAILKAAEGMKLS